MAPNKTKKKDKDETVDIYKKRNVQQRRIPIDDDVSINKMAKKRNEKVTSKSSNVIDSPIRTKRINDYLLNISEKPITVHQDEVIDCCDEKTTNSNEQHVPKKKKKGEQNDSVTDSCDQVTAKSNEKEPSKSKEINNGMSNVVTAARHAILDNPYAKKHSENKTDTKDNDDNFSMPSVPQVVNVAKENSNVVSPFSKSDHRARVVHQNLGLNAMSSETASSLGINILPIYTNLRKYYDKPTARIRCAYINGKETQSVVFFYEELTPNAYHAQTYFLNQLKNNSWVQTFYPWELPGINSDLFKLFMNNKFVEGRHLGHGYTLFIYTHQVPVQNREKILATAHKLCPIVQKIVKNKQIIIVEDDKFFLHNDACVWSSIINKNACVSRLTIEANDMILNSLNKVCNPKFWDKHEAIIRKYYQPKMLSVELAIQFNAPLEEIKETNELTPELVELIKERRNQRNNFQDIVQEELPSNIDPTSQVNYCFSSNETKIYTEDPSHEELADFINNTESFD